MIFSTPNKVLKIVNLKKIILTSSNTLFCRGWNNNKATLSRSCSSSSSNKNENSDHGSEIVKKKSLLDRFESLLHVPDSESSVTEELKKLYNLKLLPLESMYKFHQFHSPPLNDSDFDSKPLVMFIGQYSTGKSSMIRYLLDTDFPGMRIGPEPTTDRFIVISEGNEEQVIPGHALVMDSNRPYAPLADYGNTFLNRFQCSLTPSSPILQGINVVDTPGILSGEKQRVDRGYDFSGVVEWFAQRVDRILLLFDAHKLDISDEFRSAVEAMRGQEDKIRIVLNKADSIDHQELMRVYGALMWSLGKIFKTPEVTRVYIGSFWDQPLRYEINERLFYAEENDLLKDLRSLSRNSNLRKLNDLIKRARLAKVHAHIIGDLKNSMPMFLGKDKAQKELIQNLPEIFRKLQATKSLPPGDFPDYRRMQTQLEKMNFSNFPKLNERLLREVDSMLTRDISLLVNT